MADAQDLVSASKVRVLAASERSETNSTTTTENGAGAKCSDSVAANSRPLILITNSSSDSRPSGGQQSERDSSSGARRRLAEMDREGAQGEEEEEERVEEVDGISYRIVAAVTKPSSRPRAPVPSSKRLVSSPGMSEPESTGKEGDTTKGSSQQVSSGQIGSQENVEKKRRESINKLNKLERKLSSMRRKSSTFVSNMIQSNFLQTSSSQESRPRRLSIYEMTKTPPPETSLEIYLSDRRRSSTISARQVQQQLEQQSTFETNYSQRQQYFKDLNQKLINHDEKLLNVVANRGQIHRLSVDIAQLPMNLALAKGPKQADRWRPPSGCQQEPKTGISSLEQPDDQVDKSSQLPEAINQSDTKQDQLEANVGGHQNNRLISICENISPKDLDGSSIDSHRKRSKKVIRKFTKLDSNLLSSTPAPDVKIGQRVAYKEYYGNEFGTIRWLGRVPQISPDWTVGVEFDNAIGDCDGSLNGRRFFIAKDCFAKFLALSDVALVDQHVGRPEPGTMISVMSAAVRPGQMISIQRVSTVHVQHCFLNAPHRRIGADILAVNTRLHCQCPSCGPCAHVIKPPTTQRLARTGKNATHMCQFSTYTCCGMESQEETLCTYTGNKVVSLPPPVVSSMTGLPPIGNSWIEGSGYLTNLQAQQSKLMPEEYRIGAAPEDILDPIVRRRFSKSKSRRGSGKRDHHHHRSHKRHSLMSDENRITDRFNNLQGEAHPPPPPPPSYLADGNTVLDTNEFYNNIQQFLPSNPQSPNLEKNQFSIVCPDKIIHEDDSIRFENTATTPTNNAQTVYRDSIENRYLFPTDEPIDSKLEADLENLSEARYGHSANSRLSSSRNIFKSLRSLVSCLNAPSNRSELDRYSESTVKLYEHGAKVSNKSMPAMAKPNEFNGQFKPQLKEKNEPPQLYNNFALSVDSKQVYKDTNTNTSHRHQSSSSDCGFSSASQNSLNFHSYPTSSPILSADDDRRTKQIYKHIVARLMRSTSVTEEDLNRLRKVLFEPRYGSCCLHQNASLTTFAPDSPGHIVADIIQKSFIHKNNFQQQIPRASSVCCQATNYCLSSLATDMVDGCKKVLQEDDPIVQAALLKEIQQQNSKSLPKSLMDGSSESMNLSSYDSLCGTAVIGDNQSNASSSSIMNKKKDQTSVNGEEGQTAGLTKAFELKLTLSINNTDKKKVRPLTEDMSGLVESYCMQDMKESSKQLNPTFNINITSAPDDFNTSSNKVVLEKVSQTNSAPATLRSRSQSYSCEINR